MMIATALTCLALNIYHEARGEPFKGQVAVGLVTMNRAQQDPKRVCAVVTKDKQFSWTITMLRKHPKGYLLMPEGVPTDSAAWVESLRAAKLVLNKRVPDFTKGSNHYHATYAKPKRWMRSKKLQKTILVGKHIFYRQIA